MRIERAECDSVPDELYNRFSCNRYIRSGRFVMAIFDAERIAMNSRDITAGFSLSLSARKRIHEACELFIEAWKSALLDTKSANRPMIEDFLVNQSGAEGIEMFTELLDVDLHYRCKTGHTPSPREYEARFPEYRDAIARVFSTAGGDDVRQKGIWTPGLHIRCPHCHNPLELVPDAELVDIDCPSCGSSFSLLNEGMNTRLAPAVTKVGNFELVERLGMGAFGTVWKARDTVLDRKVAVKIPRASQLTSDEAEKFFREARAAAQLRHPNIVSVYEVGRDGDTIYIVSEFVRGVPLSDLLADRRLSHREAAQLALKVVMALEHAHKAGVIHRDLKPQNIMIDGNGEPHLMDFGLAKREAGEITITVDGQIFGTPAYMSPEQARGEGHHADRRTDVYSFGVLLFQLLTGELPFRGSNPMLIHKILNDEVTSLRRLDRNISKDLETICLKCLEKEPDSRFDSASDIADELGRHLRGEPIHTRNVSAANRAWRWSNRNPIGAMLLAVLVAVAIVSPLTVIWLAHLVSEKNEALYQSLYEQARAQWHSGEAGWRAASIDAVQTAADIRVEPKLTELAVEILATHDDEIIGEFKLPNFAVLAIASDGNEFAIVTGNESRVERRSAKTGKLLASWNGESNVTCLKYNSDSQQLAIGNESGNVWVWALEGPHPEKVFTAHDSRVEAITFGPGQNRISTTDGTRMCIWDALLAKRLYTDVITRNSPADPEEEKDGGEGELRLTAAVDELVIAAVDNAGLGNVWKFDDPSFAATQKTSLVLGDHAMLLFMNNAQYLVAAFNDFLPGLRQPKRGAPSSDDGMEIPFHEINESNVSLFVRAFENPLMIPFWNAQASNLIAHLLAYAEDDEVPPPLPEPTEEVYVAPSTETTEIISFAPPLAMQIELGKRRQEIRQLGPRRNVKVLLLDVENEMQAVDVVDIALGRLVGLSIDPQTNQLMVAGDSGGVGLCTIQGDQITCRRAWHAVSQDLDAAFLYPNATNYLTVQAKSQVEFHRLAGVDIHDMLLRTADEWSRIAFNDNRVIVARWESGVTFHDRDSGIQRGGLEQPTIFDLEITDRGDRIATLDSDSAVLVMAYGLDEKEAKYLKFTGTITPFVPQAIALRGDGRFLGVAGKNASINLWEYADEEYRFLRRLEPTDASFRQLVFSADNRLAAGSDDGSVTIWHTQNWSPLRQIDDGSASPVSALAFNGAESALAVGHSSGALSVHDLATSNKKMLSFEHEVLSLDFHSESPLLLVGLRDGTILVCDSSQGQVLRRWHGHNESVVAVSFDVNGTSFTSGGSNGEVRHWYLQRMEAELQQMGFE